MRFSQPLVPGILNRCYQRFLVDCTLTDGQKILVQQGGCTHFSPTADIDPDYAEALRHALARGVRALAVYCQVTPAEITIAGTLPMEFSDS